MFPPNSSIEALTLNVTVFGDGTFKEVIEVYQGHKGGALPDSTGGVLTRRRRDMSALHTCRKERPRGTRREGSHVQAGTLALQEADPALILHLQPPKLGETNSLMGKPSSPWCFVTAALGD